MVKNVLKELLNVINCQLEKKIAEEKTKVEIKNERFFLFYKCKVQNLETNCIKTSCLKYISSIMFKRELKQLITKTII